MICLLANNTHFNTALDSFDSASASPCQTSLSAASSQTGVRRSVCLHEGKRSPADLQGCEEILAGGRQTDQMRSSHIKAAQIPPAGSSCSLAGMCSQNLRQNSVLVLSTSLFVSLLCCGGMLVLGHHSVIFQEAKLTAELSLLPQWFALAAMPPCPVHLCFWVSTPVSAPAFCWWRKFSGGKSPSAANQQKILFSLKLHSDCSDVILSMLKPR